MNSEQIHDLFEEISKCGLNEKVALLKQNDCKELRKVLIAAYDTSVTYYIKQIDEPFKTGDNFLCNNDFYMLDDFDKLGGLPRKQILDEALTKLNKKSQTLLINIVKRDLRCGINTSVINKAFPKLLKTYPYMRCDLFNKVDTSSWDWDSGVYGQVKMDGAFVSITYDEEPVMRTRQGNELTNNAFSDIIRTIADEYSREYQYHGELLIFKDGKPLPRELNNGVINSLLKGGTLEEGNKPVVILWDMIDTSELTDNSTSGKNVDVSKAGENVGESKAGKSQYWERLTLLTSNPQTSNVKHIETVQLKNKEAAFAYYAKQLAAGQEGIIVKNPKGLWKNSKSKDCLKLKLEVDVDLKIVGFTEGKGKFANTFGSIQMETSDGLLEVSVSGINDNYRDELNKNRDTIIGSIAKVRANDVTKSKPVSLYLPKFVEIRTDKTVADSLEEVIAQFDNAKLGK